MIDRFLAPATNRHQPSHRFAARMAVFFGALFLIYGVHVTYFPVWLHWRGLTSEEIGFIVGVPIFVRVLATPAIAAYADARGNHRRVIIALAGLSLALALLMSGLTTFWSLMLAAVPFSIAVSSIMPLTETVAVAGVRAAGHDYGRMRLWGSFTFLLATAGTGALVDAIDGRVGIFVLIAGTVATFGASLLMPKPTEEALAQARAPQPPGAGLALLTSPVFLLFLLSVGAINASHVTFYTFGAIHLKSQGVSGTAFGAMWAVSVFAEMALFSMSGAIAGRFGPLNLILVGGVAAVIRWGAMSLDPGLGVALMLQALHALTYGATHLGAIHFMARAVPNVGAGTAQAFYSSLASGLVTGVATIVAGQLYPHLGGKSYLVMAAIAALGIAAAIAVGKMWGGGPLIEPERAQDTSAAA
jgi:MFS transporter, PPP family, 3-phenylpropionic acid transporter